MKVRLVLVLLLVPAVAFGVEPDVEGFVAASRVHRERLLESAIQKFEYAVVGKTGEELDAAIEDAERQIWEYANPDTIFLVPVTLEVGSVGDGSLATVSVQQVVGKYVALVKWNGKLALLKTDTTDLTDGQNIEMVGEFWCSGTHTYETALGTTNTVPVLESIDIEEHKAKLARELAESEIDGKKVPAEFIGYHAGRARFITPKGIEGYKLSQLSDDGRKVVKEWIDKQREAKAKAKEAERQSRRKTKR